MCWLGIKNDLLTSDMINGNKLMHYSCFSDLSTEFTRSSLDLVII